MQNMSELFSPGGDTIDLTGIESLVKLCKYHPQKKDQFFSGLELADDLYSDHDVTLYTKGTTITSGRVTRLLNILENNPNHVMMFTIKRIAELIANFRKDVLTKLSKLREHKKNYKVYDGLIGSIAKEIQTIIDEMLSDENILLTVFKM